MGNWACRYVRISPLLGVKVWTWRSSREGCAEGILTVGGPKKMVFSVFAYTVHVNKSMRVRKLSIMNRSIPVLSNSDQIVMYLLE